MDLSYIQDCPSCGAPLELEEADKVVDCPFCDGKNYMIDGAQLRFVLPHLIPAEVGEDEIFHIPYLRFKGHIYSCHENEMVHKIIDTTQLGFSSSLLPHSLGLRPQAMNLRLVSAEHPGRFVRATEKAKDIFQKAAKLISVFSDETEIIHHRAFIGETISFIYLPTYFKEGKLFDGVLNREITRNLSRDLLKKLSVTSQKSWLPQFISTLCPHCAASMSGSKESLVMHCQNCRHMWKEVNGNFTKLDYSVVSSSVAELYLPFWKISATVKGVKLNTYGDFLRLTNQPVVVREKYDAIKMFFWVPAFKIRPRYFLHFAKNITLSQLRIPRGNHDLHQKLYTANLSLTEAIQALKAILTASVMNKRNFIPQLKQIKMSASEAEMIFLPFHYIGHDLVQDHTHITVAANTLHYGKTM